ncbi:hypothetical protein BGZ65_003813 [Modicella reniformis]|uniref:Major facilitator superfamily (MFS) profile domain-containing protein n=1 Tax=Modicella reniformis TaxID=1440133 RepID=A0A9P6STJ3_9FUNG|nr:hypothetical protein BGZ65_003813 [Modicella reniformis]
MDPEKDLNTVVTCTKMDDVNKPCTLGHENSSPPKPAFSKDLEQQPVITELKTTTTAATTTAPVTYPEGGFGWLVVFGAFMIQFCCYGFAFCWGIYQEHFIQENIFPGSTLSQLSWVGGIAVSSVFITGPFQAPMVRHFGLRPVIAAGILISSSGLVLASFASSLWQLYLTQACQSSSIAVPVQWFEKKRGLVSGITVAGSGIGGASMASLHRYLISHVGYRWALRVEAILSVVIVMSILPCIRTRLPNNKKRGEPIFDFSLFTNHGFRAIICLGVNAISRVIVGIIADKFGRIKVMILCTIMGGLSCYALWLNTKDLTMAVIFMIVYGIGGGGFVSLFPVVAAEIIGVPRNPLICARPQHYWCPEKDWFNWRRDPELGWVPMSLEELAEKEAEERQRKLVKKEAEEQQQKLVLQFHGIKHERR